MSDFVFPENIKLLVYDCDGVLTDNKVIVDENGKEYATFNRGDGYGIAHIRELGIEQIVVSTEINPIVVKRCEKLKLPVVNAVENKEDCVRRYCCENDILLEDTMFIGNDLNDLSAMNAVGYRGCPKDAEPEIINVCDWISSKNGGDGVIRELSRQISFVRN